MGRPNNAASVRALRARGAPESVVKAAKALKRSICAEHRPPRVHRSALLPRARHFGDRIHVDLLQIENATGI
eukprot:2974846-Alexandrium_andersonii.AAC.1